MSKLPDPWSNIAGLLRKIEDRLSRLEGKSPFFGTGMRPNGSGGIDSENFEAGVSGYRFTDNGNAEFNDLTLRGGIVGNDALAEPISPARLHDDVSNFNVTTSWATILSVSTTVPSGYTRALVLNFATGATAYNQTAAVDFLYCRGQLSTGTLGGWTIGSVDVDATGTGVAYDFKTGLLTGLTAGATITFSGQVSSAFGTWSTFSGNVANLDVALLWLR